MRYLATSLEFEEGSRVINDLRWMQILGSFRSFSCERNLYDSHGFKVLLERVYYENSANWKSIGKITELGYSFPHIYDIHATIFYHAFLPLFDWLVSLGKHHFTDAGKYVSIMSTCPVTCCQYFKSKRTLIYCIMCFSEKLLVILKLVLMV